MNKQLIFFISLISIFSSSEPRAKRTLVGFEDNDQKKIQADRAQWRSHRRVVWVDGKKLLNPTEQEYKSFIDSSKEHINALISDPTIVAKCNEIALTKFVNYYPAQDAMPRALYAVLFYLVRKTYVPINTLIKIFHNNYVPQNVLKMYEEISEPLLNKLKNMLKERNILLVEELRLYKSYEIVLAEKIQACNNNPRQRPKANFAIKLFEIYVDDLKGSLNA